LRNINFPAEKSRMENGLLITQLAQGSLTLRFIWDTVFIQKIMQESINKFLSSLTESVQNVMF